MKTIYTVILLLILLVLSQSIGDPVYVLNKIDYLMQPYDLRGVAKGIIYLTTYIFTVLTFIIILGLRSFKLFIFFLFVIFILYTIDFFVQLLGVSHGFSMNEYALAMNEAGNIKNLLTYIYEVMYAMGLSFLFVFILYIIRAKIYKVRFSKQYLLIALIPIFIVYFAASKVGTINLNAYTAAIKIPAIALEYKMKFRVIQDRIFDDNIQPENEAKINTIIWIVDESITGSYLSINGYKKDTTPYLKSLLKNTNKVSNFGIVNSISNCSAESNLFLRIGMNPDSKLDFKKARYELPTIFQYAKRAGYTTWLFDSQAAKDHLQDYLTLYDKEDIDHFETLDSKVDPKDRDRVFLDKYTKIINSRAKNEKLFIVVVKFGAHWPYLLSYNNAYSPFTPAMETSLGGMDLEHKEKQINTYLNAIVYSTDLYFKKLISKIDLSDTVVFYTSDHGQNILELNTTKRTHCNSDIIVKNEVSVPLLVFHDKAKALFPVNKNLFYSQIQIFPTTLSLLGYGKDIVNKYGKTLSEGYLKSNDRNYFLLNVHKVNIYK